jgi:transposase
MTWTKIKLTDKQIEQLNIEESKIKNPTLLKRLQCIKLKNIGWKNKDMAVFFNVCIETISHWLKAYERSGIDGLVKWENKGRVSSLSIEQVESLKEKNKERPFEKASEAKEFIEKNFGVEFHLHYVQKLLKKNFIYHTKKQS